jgi:hypothetical protein
MPAALPVAHGLDLDRDAVDRCHSMIESAAEDLGQLFVAR